MNYTKPVITYDFGGRIFTAAVRDKKKHFSWAKNTVRGVRFLLRFNFHMRWAQFYQVHLFLAFAHS